MIIIIISIIVIINDPLNQLTVVTV